MIGSTLQQEILRKLSERCLVYIVGGAVRDEQLQIPSKDIDAVAALPLQEINSLLSDWGYNCHLMGVKKQTVSVFQGSHRLDIATFTGDVEEDALRRDFTINSIYCEVGTETIIDPLNGRIDIKNKRMKACGRATDRLSEDPLRILRLVRFIVRYGFDVEVETWQAAVENVSLLKNISSERIAEEFARILILEEVVKAIRLLDDLGYLRMFIPELARLKGLVQNRYHTKDAWEHTLLVVGNTPPLLLLRLTALLHDVGKWETASRECYVRGVVNKTDSGYEVEGFKLVGKDMARWKNRDVEVHGGIFDNYPKSIQVKNAKIAGSKHKHGLEMVLNGKRHFLNHEKESAIIVQKILPRFRWSMVLPGGRAGEQDLLFLVGNHMVGTLTFMNELKEESEVTNIRDKACRFAWKIGWSGKNFDSQRVNNLLQLWRADYLGGKLVGDEGLKRFNWIQGEIREASDFLTERDKLLEWSDFHEFCQAQGLKGERYGQFKEQVRTNIMLNPKITLADLWYLEREYKSFLKKDYL